MDDNSPQERIIHRMVDNCLIYVRGVTSSWKNSKMADIVNLAILEATSAIKEGSVYLGGDETMHDTKELRRYLSEMLLGAASWSLRASKVPDSKRLPARLTIVTLLEQWCDQVKTYPTV